MLPKNEWWKVISTYNEGIFPLQWIGLIIIVCITTYLVFGDHKRANNMIKVYLMGMNGFIGIRFFFLSEGFPAGLRIGQGILFLTIAFLMGADLKLKKLEFQFPKKGWKRILFVVGIVSIVIVYPLVGALLGKEMNNWIMLGTLPCPTTAYALLLFITAKERNNKSLFLLLLIWAVPFPPLVQIPKYQVYEDGIMFVLGLIGVVFFINDIVKRKKGMNRLFQKVINLKKYKEIFDIKKDAVLSTSSAQGILNIVPIHSKHLISRNRVLISDQFMNKTKKNILENPYASLTILEKGKLWKLSGKCKYRANGFFYLMAVRGTKKYAKKKSQNKQITIKCKGIILMRVDEFEIEEV